MPALGLVLLTMLAGAPAPPKPTRLKIDVKPETAVVILDGVKRGTGAKSILITVTPGRHKVKVINKGDSVEDFIVAKKGETQNWQWEFTDDIPKKNPTPEPTDDDATPKPDEAK